MPAPQKLAAAASLRERLAVVLLDDPRVGAKSLGWICASMTVGILLIALWPLCFSAPNNAEWLAATNGLRFPGGEARSAFDPGGIVHSVSPLTVSPAKATGAFSVEILLRPAKEPTGAQGRIVALADAAGIEPFFIGQWSTQLLVMVRQSGANGNGAFREFDVRDSFKAGQTRLVTLTADGTNCAIYLDGGLGRQLAGVSLLGANGSLAGHRVFLGNSPDGLHPWEGDVLGLALYEGALSASQAKQTAEGWLRPGHPLFPAQPRPLARYDFGQRAGRLITNSIGVDDPLFMPATLEQRKPRLSLEGFIRPGLGDLVLNIVGFVPYGLAIALWVIRLRPAARWTAPLVAMLIGTLVSLGIEWAQVWLPMRDSSVVDVVANALGALLGGLVPLWCSGSRATPVDAPA